MAGGRVDVTLAPPASVPAVAHPSALGVVVGMPAPTVSGAAKATPSAVGVVVGMPAASAVVPSLSNVSDRDFWWIDTLSPADGNPGTSELMDSGDWAYFRARGMDGVVMKFPYTSFVGMGSDQTFPPDPANVHPTSTAHRDARKLKNVVMPALAAAGLGAVAVVDLKNRTVAGPGGQILTGVFPPGGGTYNTDTAPSTAQKISDWANFCRAVGFEGLMFDGENYPSNDSSTGSIWGGQEFTTQWKARGYEVGFAIATAWPDVCLMAYHNFLPGSYDEIERGEVFEPNGSGPGTGYSQANFYSGVTLGMADAAPSGAWCMHFMEATHFRGPQPTGYRQQDICGTAAWFSRNWAHWWRVFDRVAVEPFIWLNDGPGAIAEDISYNPTTLASDAANLRNWHVVTVGDRRIRQHFVYDAEITMPSQALDCSPYNFPADYASTLVTMSTPTTVSNAAPVLTISAPSTGSTGASSVTVVTGTVTEADFGVVGVTWENEAWAVGHANRKGQVAMTFNKLSGSISTSFTWRMDLSLTGVAGAIPLAMGANLITFTARDSKGATHSVQRTVTRV